MYEYQAVVVSVHDGDTICCDVDLGFGVWRHGAQFRLAGVSARELSMPGGKEARDNLARLLPPGIRVTVCSGKVEADPADLMSFTRYVVTVTLTDGRDLTECLKASGWAVAWDGRKKPCPWPAWPRL